MRSKKLYHAACSLALTGALLVAGGAPAMAHELSVHVGTAPTEDPITILRSNTSNSSFSFPMPANGTHGTGGRAKQDASPTYVRIDSITRPCRMYVDGASSSSGVWYNCTNGGYARAYRTGHFQIHQTVYESGYRWARLTAWANEGASTVKGAWSPDCAGSYPDMN